MPMPLIPDIAVFQRELAGFPLATYQAGETVLTAASTTGRLLILRQGAVAVVKEGVEIAKVTEPGAVFGELSVLLDQPHTAAGLLPPRCQNTTTSPKFGLQKPIPRAFDPSW
jgi:CRP/FNR family cyclic AMP-dependent transcriptional regulator